ncbi:hypothetical protein IM40_03640 [Candidatus Paracaedimonas acanthamoebae]|nr:hypothetical protein IM40_03640 [Candidatus Paracaedimonas acanthamoebae]
MYKNFCSLNYNVRSSQASIEYLIYHYTACDFATSLKILCNDKAEYPVSAHYLIDENGDIYQLVDEDKRAWHAGKSSWEGREDINSWSIGIELVNPGHGPHYRPFPKVQMEALAHLSLQIIDRYKIKPWNVLGHADIAPTRKIDPGELFNWNWLALQGIGIMPSLGIVSASNDSLEMIQELLKQYGYGIDSPDGNDSHIQAVVRAFQMHFTPSHITKQPNVETCQALLSLLEKKNKKG